MKRHDIDDQVLDFVINRFSEGFDGGQNWLYRYQDDNIEITMSRSQLTRLNSKIAVNFYRRVKDSNSDIFHTKDRLTHELSHESSNKLRKFIEDLEDEKNSDLIRNTSNKILKFIKEYK